MRVWSTVAETIAAQGACALVTVAAVRGSAPREAGARMVVGPDGGFRGTVGGGELEWRALGAARDALARGAPAAALSRFALGPDLGQCCGGSVRVLTEVFDRGRLDEARALAAREAAGPFATRGRIGPRSVERIVVGDDEGARGAPGPAGGRGGPSAGARSAGNDDRPAPEALRGGPIELGSDGLIVERFRDPRHPVWLFGAGHVGRALMLALAPLPFEVTWIDERDGAFPAAVPANVRPLRSADAAAEVARAPADASIVVMTHHHPLDLAIVHAALAAERFGYVGLIGSASKRARFTRRLREAGVAEARIAELVCPIGMPAIRSKHPAAIATGIAAQLLERAGPPARGAAGTGTVR